MFDALLRDLEWQAVLKRANEDRATTAALSTAAAAGLSITLPPTPAPTFQPWIFRQQSQTLSQPSAIPGGGDIP